PTGEGNQRADRKLPAGCPFLEQGVSSLWTSSSLPISEENGQGKGLSAWPYASHLFMSRPQASPKPHVDTNPITYRVEIRRPKSEGRRKPQVRNPNAIPGFREFGFRISFGFRVSDFGFC